jgi:hypothetical protein
MKLRRSSNGSIIRTQRQVPIRKTCAEREKGLMGARWELQWSYSGATVELLPAYHPLRSGTMSQPSLEGEICPCE